MNRVIGYIRVSTDEQAEKGFSLRHQKVVIEQWCKIGNHDLVTIYEEDYSAKTFDRPEMNKLMAFAKANRKNIDLIICTKWDRFSRNVEEALRAIRQLKELGIKVITIEQPLDLDIPDNKILLALYLTVPEVENDKNSIRTTDGMRRANKEGCWTGTPPFGYSNVRSADGKSTLHPNEKAEIVKEAFQLFSLGLYSMEEVRKRLRKQGMKLTKNGFAAMLKNVAYIGKVKIKAKGKEDEEVVIGLHPAIISDELFEKVLMISLGKKKST